MLHVFGLSVRVRLGKMNIVSTWWLIVIRIQAVVNVESVKTPSFMHVRMLRSILKNKALLLIMN